MCLFSHFPFALSERKIEGHLYPERCSGLYACWAFSPSLLHANPLYSIVMIDTSYDGRLFHWRVVLLEQKQIVVFCQQTTLLKVKDVCVCSNTALDGWHNYCFEHTSCASQLWPLRCLREIILQTIQISCYGIFEPFAWFVLFVVYLFIKG